MESDPIDSAIDMAIFLVSFMLILVLYFFNISKNMKKKFCGYYSPTSEEYEALWKQGLIVLDTNVLLDLYRFPTTARDEFIGVLESLKDRLWIPHQVALEFQRRRLTVISSRRKSIEEALDLTNALFDGVKKKVNLLELDKLNLNIDPQLLLSNLEKANSELLDAITTARDSQLDFSSHDPIRHRLDDLLDTRVGSSPDDQAALDLLVFNGENRFADEIPPGFQDAPKAKNPNEATFVFDGLKYQSQFGDLILWRQLIQHAKSTGATTILLVTSDRKEDWWWKEQGKIIGPHPALIREIQREAGVQLFWMYSSPQFTKYANTFTAGSISSSSMEEIQQVALSDPPNRSDFSNMNPDVDYSFFADSMDHKHSVAVVAEWVANRMGRARIVEFDTADVVAYTGEGIFAYKVLDYPSNMGIGDSAEIFHSLSSGQIEVRKGDYLKFTLVLIISELMFNDSTKFDSKMVPHLFKEWELFLKSFPNCSVLLGMIRHSQFNQLVGF